MNVVQCAGGTPRSMLAVVSTDALVFLGTPMLRRWLLHQHHGVLSYWDHVAWLLRHP